MVQHERSMRFSFSFFPFAFKSMEIAKKAFLCIKTIKQFSSSRPVLVNSRPSRLLFAMLMT